MSGGLPGPGIRPDAVVALQIGASSGVLCIEMDEGTQHAPLIRARLSAYGRALPARPGWHLLFVVQTDHRAGWLRRLATWNGPAALAGLSWAVRLADLEAVGLDAVSAPLLGAATPVPLHAVLTDHHPRATPTPVGSLRWAELLGAGGGDDLDRALR